MSGDDWETPAEAFTELAARLDMPRDAVVWDPFYCQGRARQYLQAAFPGRRILHEANEDFFVTNHEEATHIVTNPPYSTSRKVLEALFARGRPFAAFVRSDTMFTQYMQALIREHTDDTVILVPSRRTAFIDPDTGALVKGVRFFSLWITYRMPIAVDNDRLAWAQMRLFV